MKFLPFTISVGKSLDRMLDEKLEQEDLNHQIERAQRRGNEDFAIRNRTRKLHLREILYKDIERPNEKPPYDSDRIIVRAFSCGLQMPNCPVTSEDEIHYDNSHTQRQVIISEDLMLVRDVFPGRFYPKRETHAEVFSCYMNPFPRRKENRSLNSEPGEELGYRMIEAFAKGVFSDKNILRGGLWGNGIGTIGGFRDDPEFGKPVHEIRLIIPSETDRQPYDLYGNERFLVRGELEKLDYKKLEEPLHLA